MGLTSGVLSAATETWRGVRDIAGSDLSLVGQGLAAGQTLIGGSTHGAIFGLGTGWAVFENSTSATWKNNSIQAGFTAGQREAGNFLAAAADPKSLLEPVKTPS